VPDSRTPSPPAPGEYLMSQRYRVSWLSALMILALPVAGRAQSTSWTSSFGDWGGGSNWSAGEPTAGVDAHFAASGNASITLSGETCRNLYFGTATGGPELNVTGGSLAVIHRIQLPVAGSARINQDGGTVTADSLVMGAAGSVGQYELRGGSLTVGNAIVGTTENFSGASLALTDIASPVLTVTHSVRLGRFADIVAGGGRMSIGTTNTDSLVVAGTFQLNGTPTITTTNFAMRDGSVLSATFTFVGLSGIVSSGGVVLDGTLKIYDFFVSDGTWELVRGNSLTGTFDAVELPATGNWSWRIEGNSVFVTKGPVAVEPSTWSGVKAGGWRR